MKNILLIFLLLLITACGGGGGDAGAPNSNSATPTPPPTPTPTPIASAVPPTITLGAITAPFPTSYENAKGYGISRIKFPDSLNTFVPDQPLAWGIGDFFQIGNISAFTAKQNYQLPSDRADWTAYFNTINGVAQYQSDLQFWKRADDGTLVAEGPTYKGCLHPRKGVVADFNQDGYPDVFVACHGYDTSVPGISTSSSMPGEYSNILLSDGAGGYTVSNIGFVDSFYHGASAADVNGDGWPDIVVVDINHGAIYFWMNNKDGTFTRDTLRVAGLEGGPYFTVELVDADGNGTIDLIVGGHEADQTSYSNAKTFILYGVNDGAGSITFGASKTLIPTVDRQGIVLDFTVIVNAANERILYINRSADGRAPVPPETAYMPYYTTQTLQIYNITTTASSVPLLQFGRWVAWWMPVMRNGVKVVQPYNDNYADLYY